MQRNNIPLQYGPGFSDKTIISAHINKISNLTILRTTEEDEGIYHCAFMDWTESTWSGTYLSIKGNLIRIFQYFGFSNNTKDTL